MKILLRNFGSEQFVWKTAKYDFGAFKVDGSNVRETDIVSIINDNRKNCVKCSCCGKVFRKGDKRFEAHKENAIKAETCFNCPHLVVDVVYNKKRKITVDEDGNFNETSEKRVLLKCSKARSWSYTYITEAETILNCKKRQCEGATEEPIKDFFTERPGVFDDLITVDQIYDKGYDIFLNPNGDSDSELIYEDEYTIGVVINSLGIVNSFYVWYDGENYDVYYSKKYDKLYQRYNKQYREWHPIFMPDDLRSEIKNKIAEFYN